MNGKKRVCVFCGSKRGKNPAFTKQAQALGTQLVLNNLELVYGGGSVGLMNIIANAVISGGGQVHGVIPEHLINKEHSHEDLASLRITNTMHERKTMMAELSDAFIALPGGFGTFEELLEIITWRQLELHKKPVIVFNIDEYYNPFISFIDQAVEQGFISKENRALLNVADSLDHCLHYLSFV